MALLLAMLVAEDDKDKDEHGVSPNNKCRDI